MSSLLLQRTLSDGGSDQADDQSDGQRGDQSDQEAEALAVAVAAAYLLTDDEVAQIAAVILAARLAAWKATYTTAAKTAGAGLPDDGPAPSAAEERKQRREADAAAASVAATYARDLASQAAQFTQDWLTSHDGSLNGVEDALRSDLATYSETRADWKAEQVAQYETGVGGQDGTQAAIDDLESGDLTDENGDPFVDLTSIVYVAILPEESSSDFCAEYAGQIFSFDDAPAIDFPAHLGCQHYQCLITAAEFSDADEASL